MLSKITKKQAKMPVLSPLLFAKSQMTDTANENALAHQDATELHRIKQKNERSTLQQRLYPLKRFILFAIFMLLIWSGITESTFLTAGFFGMTNNWFASIGVTLLLVGLLETSKFYLGSYTLRFIACGWIKESWRYVVAFLILCPIMIAVYFGSYTMSVKGAPRIANFVNSQTEQLPLINTDSIQTHFDNKIVLLLDAQKEAKNTKWRGMTTNSATKLTMSYQEQINLLEQQRNEALTLAQQSNESLQNLSKDQTIDWGQWLSLFGGYGEILTICFLFFLELYDRFSYLELPNYDQVPTVASQIPITENKLIPESNELPEKMDIPTEQSHSQPITHLDNSILEENTTVVVVNGKVPYQGKNYDESRFKDWLKKAKYRSENNATLSSRKSNKERYDSLLKAWQTYQDSIQQA